MVCCSAFSAWFSTTSVEHTKNVKLVIFAPESHVQIICKALGDAGAGKIGRYDFCSFISHGTASFRPLLGSQAKSGKLGLVEEVKEVKIETVCCASIAKKVVEAVRKVHPYDEMGYDIIPLLSLIPD